MIVSEYVLKFLEEIGVTDIFGIPGYANFPLYGFLPTTGINNYLAKHEEGAAFMAYGYAQARKNVAAVSATSGAASLHLFTGLAAAYANSVPMFVVTGEVDTWKIGRCAFQEMSGLSPRSPDLSVMFNEVTIFTEQAKRAEDVPGILARAYAAFHSMPQGPVHICIPVDIMKMEFEAIDWRTLYVPPKTLAEPSAATINEVCDALNNASSPMVIFGRGCADSHAELVEFIEAWDIPFCTSMQGKGVAHHDSPWHLGILGTAGSPRANNWIHKVDTLLVVGSSLNEFTTSVYSNLPRDGLKVIRVDVDANAAQSHIPAVCFLQSRAKDFLKLMAKKTSGLKRDFEKPLQEMCAQVSEFAPIAHIPGERPGVIPMDILSALAERAPSNARFVTDAGNNAAWTVHFLKLKGEQEFFIDINTGCMGNGVASAIGLQVADPSRQVISIVGDGGMYMLGNEVSVAADHDIPVIWIVFNDTKLGMVKQGLRERYGIETACNYHKLDLSLWARGLGATVLHVESQSELLSALDSVLLNPRSSGPFVLDVLIDDAYLPNFYPRTLRTPAEDHMFQAVQNAMATKQERLQKKEKGTAQLELI